MSTDLAVYNPPEIDVMDRLDTATIDELTEAFHTELAKAEQGVQHALSHYLRCGEVLHELRQRVANGEWLKWCTDNEMNHSWISRLIRIYVYRDLIDLTPRVDARGRIRFPTLQMASALVSGMPPSAPSGAFSHPQEIKATAVRMKADGASSREISSLLGVPAPTVRTWVNPEGAKRSRAKGVQQARERAAARVALNAVNKRAERDALAKANGKELSVAYGAVRQALAALARADRSACPEAFKKADTYLTSAESAIVQALRAERQDH